MLTFEIPAVKCLHGVEVNWCRYRDTGVTDPALLQRYPVGQKFHQNRSISHGFRDISIFVFSLFGKFVMIN